MITHRRPQPPTPAQRTAVTRQRVTAALTLAALICLTATLWLATVPSAWLWAAGVGFLVCGVPAFLRLADPAAGEQP